MVVQHQGKNVFDYYCDQIRNLAVGGTPFAFDDSCYVKGASSILITVSLA